MTRAEKGHASAQTLFLRWAVYTAAGLTVAILLTIVCYIIIKGVPNISADIFSLHYTSDNASLFPAMVNTLTMTVLSLLFAGPVGIFSAIYLVEYAPRGSRLVALVRITAETLSGIPSIVYGLFGLLLFVTTLGLRYSMLSGALTLAIMILPVIMRTAEEALKAVPDTYREGSFGLGAGKLRTVFRIVLPAAIPGILAGVLLSVGRIVGETAALIYTAGTVAQVSGLLSSGRTLSVHMYALWNEGLKVNQAYAAGLVLLVTVILINAVSSYIAGKIAAAK